ncbi:hypothetical protein J2X85_001640 [Microbacterium trichothecenolyticum]|uniref:antitoxin VbhA family protein n=1 Tax=Microbacterium trichothecenolyticum TaxID=69370 RepID=UPI00285F0317|nr:hypothetical protein [Microbacterium trichothecenolyticum]MDR7184617.1 hypothetical protein [Microbacterium trichothecenolyticum]
MIEDMHAALERAQRVELSASEGGRTLDVVALWPELFEGLDEAQRDAIRQSFAANWHEGWQPNRDDVADLTAQTRGEIDAEEYMRRARARARSSRSAAGS